MLDSAMRNLKWFNLINFIEWYNLYTVIYLLHKFKPFKGTKFRFKTFLQPFQLS